MTSHLGLFQGYGIELEYMVVDRRTLDVRPIVDELIKDVTGSYLGDVENDLIDWSNELALHVLELKNNHPVPHMEGLQKHFHQEVLRINDLLGAFDALLMPTAMHPWMNPDIETKLWPHSNKEVYSHYNQVFNCSGHGWSNLQSSHINLPFSNDEEFEKLHAATRLVLPLIPALAASSPFFEGSRHNGALDQRLEFYFKNQKRIPSIIGDGIPEQVWSIKDYHSQILAPMYQDIAPFDQEGILQHDWLNSRAVIPKFSRNCLEIRNMDIQESPTADLSIIQWIVALVKSLCEEQFCSLEMQKSMTSSDLKVLMLSTIKDAEAANISHPEYLKLFTGSTSARSAQSLLQNLHEKYLASRLEDSEKASVEEALLNGTLSRRILAALQNDYRHENLLNIYRRLAECLQINSTFYAN